MVFKKGNVMKKSYLWLTCAILAALSVLTLSVSVSAFGPGSDVVVAASNDCDACNDCSGGFYPGFPHPGFPLPGGALADSNFGRRAIPAPVYFANTYPEYLYGSPNIYAGFDQYDTDVAFVSPVISKSPFHYDYYNDQYNYSPYYGKRWEKNWYITDQVVYRSDDGGAGALGAEASYGDSSAQPLSLTNGSSAAPAPSKAPAAPVKEDPAVPTTESAPANDLHITQVSYTVSPTEDAYRGRFIYNFESFCDDDPPCFLTRPISCLARVLFGCPSCGVCGGRGGYCCAAYSGHGGYGGFNCPAYRRGGCGKPFIDPYAAPYTLGAVGDCCGGIYVDSYIEGGVYVDGNSCGCLNETYVTPIENAVVDKSEEPAVKDDEVVSTDDKAAESQNINNPAPSDGNTNFIPRTEQPAAPAPGADPTQPSVPVPGTEDEDGFPEPITTSYKLDSDETVGSIQMAVPENAVVIINGYRTKLSGTDRTFLAKNLVPGEVYSFEIKVLIEKNGNVYSGVKETELRAGENTLVVFQTGDFRQENLTYASK